MKQVRIYKISLYPIFTLMLTGGVMLFSLCASGIKEILSNLLISIAILLFSFLFLAYSFYLLRKRSERKGFYWDDEGVVIDLKGTKIYWEEIESIQYVTTRGMQSTVIYPHYTYHEKIRARRKKLLPTTAHSVDWFFVKNPKEWHKNLMKAWEEKRH